MLPEHDLRPDLGEVGGGEPGDRGARADGHERRRLDAPVRRDDEAAARPGRGVDGADGERKQRGEHGG